MPLLAKQHTPISELDLLSWFFDDPSYDLDKPVGHTERRAVDQSHKR
jgi:hypothetical protein